MSTAQIVRLAFVFLVFSVCLLAQTSDFGLAAQAVSNEAVFIGRAIAVAIMIFAGLSLMGGGHEHHVGGKITTIVVGLIFVVFARNIMNWVQTNG